MFIWVTFEYYQATYVDAKHRSLIGGGYICSLRRRITLLTLSQKHNLIYIRLLFIVSTPLKLISPKIVIISQR